MTELRDLIDEALRYITAMHDCIEKQEYEKLIAFEQELFAVNTKLQQVNVQQVQHHIKELSRLNEKLTSLRDMMELHRDNIRVQLEQAGQSGHAAKAYTKSAHVVPRKNNE